MHYKLWFKQCKLFIVLLLTGAVGLFVYNLKTDRNIAQPISCPCNCITDGQLKAAAATVGAARIPKIIHMVFKSQFIYKPYEQFINSCLHYNSDWIFIIWRDFESAKLIKAKYPILFEKYQHYSNIERSDVIRYVVLYEYGGIYIDMDVECKQPMFPTVQHLPAFVDQERQEQSRILWEKEFMAMNNAMGSVPKHPFFLEMIRAMERVTLNNENKRVMNSTGPMLLTRVYQNWTTNNRLPIVHLLPSKLMSPKMDGAESLRVSECAEFIDKDGKILNAKRPLAYKACQLLRNNQISFDLTDQDTIAVHHFLHFGWLQNNLEQFGQIDACRQFEHRISFFISGNE